MSGINKTILLGHVGKVPELRLLSNGQPVMNFSIATSQVYTTRDGKRTEKTQWHRCTFYGKRAEVLSQFIKKGSRLYIEGQIEYREFEKDGQRRFVTDIIVSDIQLLGEGRPDADEVNRITQNVQDEECPF